jgi:hypothetical protein
MKKVMTKVNFAVLSLMMAMSSVLAQGAATTASTIQVDCEMIKKLGEILGTLRILAFIGAGFTIAGWAWTYISKGDVGLDDVKKKGVALLVGFGLLFSIGIALGFFQGLSAEKSVQCLENFKTW